MPEFGAWASRWWIPVLFVLVAGHLTNVCVTLFLHRAQTHRGVRLHAIAALPMRIPRQLMVPGAGGQAHAPDPQILQRVIDGLRRG